MKKTEALTVLPPDPLTPAVEASGMEIATSRQAQEVMAAMGIAKRFPRNETMAIARIMGACNRISLAESALYSYPRGGTTVTGPSIRMAEALARGWGNIDFGVIELEQKNGESIVLSYAWDLETNTRVTKVFSVKHERKASGQIKKLDDPRDIYEMVANQGARRLRACILGVIPGDITDMAVEACEQTMKSGDKTPMRDRIAKCLSFLNGIGVTSTMIEKRLGHKLETISETELVALRKIAKTLDDNAAKVEDFFDKSAVGSSESSKPVDTLPTKSAPEKDEFPMDGPTPLAKAEPAPEPEKPVAAEMSEATVCVEKIAELALRDSVSEDKILAYCKKAKLCGAKVEQLDQMLTSKLNLIVSEWDHIVDKIKAA
jgi:hypothetical protein